jgi:hypothetical protein
MTPENPNRREEVILVAVNVAANGATAMGRASMSEAMIRRTRRMPRKVL